MSLVDLILTDDVPKLGEAGDLVRVKPGFARNYLLPQGKAAVATKAKVKELEHQKRVITEKLAKELKDLEAVKHKIESIVLEFTAQAGEEGKLFGSITAANIAEQLGEKGIEVDRRKLGLAEAIKSVGEHKVALKLRGQLEANVKVVVTAAE
jgi:large subunit ribosomal protein L9